MLKHSYFHMIISVYYVCSQHYLPERGQMDSLLKFDLHVPHV